MPWVPSSVERALPDIDLPSRSTRTHASAVLLSSSERDARHVVQRIQLRLCRLKLGRLPAYQQLLALGKERKNPILLDIGCCCKYATAALRSIESRVSIRISQSATTSGRLSQMVIR